MSKDNWLKTDGLSQSVGNLRIESENGGIVISGDETFTPDQEGKAKAEALRDLLTTICSNYEKIPNLPDKATPPTGIHGTTNAFK